MNSTFAERQQRVDAQLVEARQQLAASEERLRAVDAELSGMSGQQQRYVLLGQVCDGLDQLEELGAAELFWGADGDGAQGAQRMQQVRARVAEYRARQNKIEQDRLTLQNEIVTQGYRIEELVHQLDELKELERKAQDEFVVERKIRQRPFRPAVMPWNRHGEDQRRYRKVLLLTLLFMLLIGGLPMVWKLPPPDKTKAVVVPERLARMIKKKQPPKPPEKIQEAKKEEQKKDDQKKDEVKPKDTPTPQEIKQARATAETKGVLAFKNSFSDLMDDVAPSNLGADAKISNAGRQAAGGAAGSRSLIVAQATGGSGGIASASISRGGVGNGRAGEISGNGVQVTRAQSNIVDMQESDRPLTAGAGPARTDEEIQIVFDRYKSALYRIYNRELRNDPSLRGKMVLAITIEPDGRVSACSVQSTDLNSAALSADIVERVLKFNFGAKDGVPVTKILYPIDFLPAS